MSDQPFSPTDLVPSARREADALIVTVRGDVDLHNSPELRVALLQLIGKNVPRKLVINMADVSYMDSSGVAVLVEVLSLVRKPGGKVYLTGVQQRVKSILEIARLNTIFALTADENEAMRK
jgi:anti-anti-sigma factor